MSIDWESLVKVALVSFAFAVGIVGVYALGIVGLSQAAGGGADSASTTESAAGTAPSRHARRVGGTLAGICFTACLAAVVFGLWLLIPQFHQ